MGSLKKTIGLIAPSTHAEVLQVLNELLCSDNYAVKFFISSYNAFIIGEAALPQDAVILKDGIADIGSEDIKDLNLLIFITINRDYALASQLASQIKSILIIHSANYYLLRGQNMKIDSIKSAMYYLQFAFSKRSFKIARLLESVSHISLTSDYISKNALNNMVNLTIRNKIIDHIPISYYAHVISKTTNDTLQFVIPGTFDIRRKNIQLLIEAIKPIANSINRKVQFIFAGRVPNSPQAHHVKKQLEALTGKNLQFTFFVKPLNYAAYEKLMISCHYLILLPRQEYIRSFVKEEYGISTITGGINDMIRYGKLTLIPKFYPVEHDLIFLIKRYESPESLTNQINTILNVEDNPRDHLTFSSFKEKYGKKARSVYLKSIISKVINR